ncbi:serine hydrolase [Flagellimonas sp. CMM7]|uniref:serine hydrolase domain-containing protein n=1 Tax=Flagellimonas sp. CMM7 TaxID=2654676 RepID=UPI0013D23E2F|nr:serine hydrolase domain-containing protein [Flagellimonas sp. CMM7]UII79508.1 beta-lactamase family protein [Flagellimonas sp. CMM7]
MKQLKLNLKAFVLLTSMAISSTLAQTQNGKLGKIQKIMDAATSNNLVGVSVYIKSPKFGKWIGTSGYSNLEEKIPLQENDIFGLASIGKTYTAVSVLKLVEEGKIGLDDKIQNYLPKEIIDGFATAKDVTIRNLLGHTSGLYNYNRNPELNELYLKGNLKLDTLSHIDALRKYAYGITEHTKPLGEYKYSSTNYLLLTMIMDTIVQNGHENFMREHIIKKYNLKDTYYKQTPPERLVGHYGDIDLNSSTENLSKQTIETTNWYSGDDGVYAPIEEAGLFLEKLVKGEILSEEILKEMMTWNDEKKPDYGLGLMADKSFPYKFLMGHSGRGIGMTTDLYYFPHKDMTIAIFCNSGLRSASKDYAKTYYQMRNKIIKKLFLF